MPNEELKELVYKKELKESTEKNDNEEQRKPSFYSDFPSHKTLECLDF